MTPTRQDQRAGCPAAGKELSHVPVTEVKHLDHLLERSFPSFGGGYLRRVFGLLDEAIGKGVPMSVAISGPVTASGQHIAWLNPLLDTGWFCLVSTTDAVCYHDGHRGLDDAAEHPFHEVPIFGDDGALRDDRTIRITDIGFDEDVLLVQDSLLNRMLLRPEFQRRMTGTEPQPARPRLRGAGVAHGRARRSPRPLPSKGHPGLRRRALRRLRLPELHEALGPGRAGQGEHRFELDLHLEVFESCAYHVWGQDADAAGAEDRPASLGALVLGGGVPKNFNLQPEPALSQILGFEEIGGYLYDIQITTAPVTDGSLSSCPPAEAVTWGKVDKDAYQRTTESMPADYSMVMPILTKALLDKRARLAHLAEELGMEELTRRHPEAPGYLRSTEGYRLLDQRSALLERLEAEVAERADAMAAELG